MSEERPHLVFGMALAKAVELALEVSDAELLRAVIERDDLVILDRVGHWMDDAAKRCDKIVASTNPHPFDVRLAGVGYDIQQERLSKWDAVLSVLIQGFPPPEVTLYTLLAEERAAQGT